MRLCFLNEREEWCIAVTGSWVKLLFSWRSFSPVWNVKCAIWNNKAALTCCLVGQQTNGTCEMSCQCLLCGFCQAPGGQKNISSFFSSQNHHKVKYLKYIYILVLLSLLPFLCFFPLFLPGPSSAYNGQTGRGMYCSFHPVKAMRSSKSSL